MILGGTSSRRALRSKKSMGTEDDPFFTGSKLDVELVSVQARLYYRAKTNTREKRPKKIIKHDDFGAQGRHYLLLWHDPGYAGQDIQDWYPANFAKTFEGLVEDYLKVRMPLLLTCRWLVCTPALLHPTTG